MKTAAVALLAFLGFASSHAETDDPAPSAKDYAALANLPDWSGVWLPDLTHSGVKTGLNPPDWTPQAAAEVAKLQALDKAGHPVNIYVNCLPEGALSQTIMTLNGTEFLFTPGRITELDEFDGNRLRRIYTDGRSHPADPDLTFNGHSIGHWEGSTLVVDTVGFLPEVYIPLGQPVGIPNNGGLHLVERIALTDPNTLLEDIEVIAPKVLKSPWHVQRKFRRSRDRDREIEEASCRQGDFYESTNEDGFAVFKPLTQDAGGDQIQQPDQGGQK